jgi:hypothetical protein
VGEGYSSTGLAIRTGGGTVRMPAPERVGVPGRGYARREGRASYERVEYRPSALRGKKPLPAVCALYTEKDRG